MADDENTEEETTGSATAENGGEATDSADEGARGEESDGEESDAKTGKNAEDKTPKSDVDDPEFGKKDDEPANEVQMKYLKPLAEHMGEDIPDDMSESDAAEKINEMQENAAS